ncbi:MAG: hypothetical protein JKX76_02595, partial [Colwellia sp.]|nr:hypothetical protein [Colwellia sp.]
SDIKSKTRSETRLVSNIKSKIRSETRLVSNIKSKIRSETRLVSVSNMKKSCMGIKSGSLRYCSNLSLSDLLFLIVKYNRINILEWFFSYEKQSPKQNQSVLFGSTGSTTGFSRKRFIYFLPWMMNIAVSYNNIEVLQWGTTIMSRSILLDHIIYPVLPDSFTLHWALKKGFVDIINWGSKQPLYITPKMRTRGFHIEDTNTQKLYSVDVSTMNKAASYGHINILEWGIHQTPCIYPNEYGLNCAASKGYLNVLIWADKFYFDCVNKKLPFLKSNVISGTSWIIPNTNSYRFSQQNTGTLEEFRLSLLPTQFGLNKAYKGGYNDVIVWGKQKNIIPSNIYILNTILKSIFSF